MIVQRIDVGDIDLGDSGAENDDVGAEIGDSGAGE